MNTAGYFCRIAVSRCLRGSSGYRSRISSACRKVSCSGRSGITRVAQLREDLLHVPLGADDDLPDLADHSFQEAQIALVRRDYALPVPLVHVGAVVVVEEVVLAHGAHVGADAFAGLAVELLQRHPLPLGSGLHHLGVDGVLVAIVGDVELDRGARSVAVEIVIDAALLVHDERHGDHLQVQFVAEVFFDVALCLEDRLLGFFG